MTLPDSVIKLDHDLTSSTSILIETRWHWTLDESNPHRVSLSEYGRCVGVAQRVISAFAHARVLLVEGRAKTAQEAIERAHMSEHTQAATEAVAEIYGVSFGQASKYYREDVADVREEARRLADELDTDFWTQLPIAVEALRQRVEREHVEGVERRANHSRAYINANARLVFARDKIATCITEVRGVDFGEEERDDLLSRIGEVLNKLEQLEGTLKATPRSGIALVS